MSLTYERKVEAAIKEDSKESEKKMINAYGVSRTRDKKGVIIKQTTLPWVNCIHTNVGGGGKQWKF